jgi:glycosyltransferase involved in cell wall biosynthesis
MTSKILYINTPTFLGGAEISLLTLMSHLDRQRYVSVLLTKGEGGLTERARRDGTMVLRQTFEWPRWRKPWKFPGSVLQIIRTMRSQSVSVVHTNCDYSLRYASLACRVTGVPFVAHVRDFMRAWFEAPHLDALKQAHRVVANSQATARACREAGIEPDKIRMIYNPVDVDFFQQPVPDAAAQLRANLGIAAEELIVGIVGQIAPIKGHEDFITAAYQLLDRYPSAHFVICGAAYTPQVQEFEDYLRQLIVQSGSSDRFHFIGFRDDVPAVLQALDVLVVPSWTESFGRVVVEGLAAGCPIVATCAGGIPEIIEDGVTGLLVPPKEPDMLADAILRLANDSSLRDQFRINGRSRAQDFGIQQHVDQVQALYDELLGVNG